MPKTYLENKIPSHLDPNLKAIIRQAKSITAKLFPDFSYQYQIEKEEDSSYYIKYWLKYNYQSWNTITYYYESNFASLVERGLGHSKQTKNLETATIKDLTDFHYPNQYKAWSPYKNNYNKLTRTNKISISEALAGNSKNQSYFDEKLAFILNLKLTKKELTLKEVKQILKQLSNLLSKRLPNTDLIAYTLPHFPLKVAIELAKEEFKLSRRNKDAINKINNVLILLASGRKITPPTTPNSTYNLDKDSMDCLLSLTQNKPINPQLFTPNLYDLKGNRINWN